MDEANRILQHWNEIKSIVEVLELDVQKTALGVANAGTRVRVAIRKLRKEAGELVKVSLDHDKLVTLARMARRENKS